MRRYFKPKTATTPRHEPRKLDDYSKIGMIVERVNTVELKINQVITSYFVSPDKQNIFMEEVMFAGRLRLNDKIKIFTAILERKGVQFDNKSFERWMKIRNMVAHGVPSRDFNTRRGVVSFNGKIYDIETEFRDFERLQRKIERIFGKI